MNKIDKYLRRFAYKIETSETKESRYYTIGDLIVRVSNHIGKNSSGNISIIIDRNNYILYVPFYGPVSKLAKLLIYSRFISVWRFESFHGHKFFTVLQ